MSAHVDGGHHLLGGGGEGGVFASVGLISSQRFVPTVTDQLLVKRNTCLTKASMQQYYGPSQGFFNNIFIDLPLYHLTGFRGHRSDSVPGREFHLSLFSVL